MRILIVQDTDWIRRNPIQHTHLAERMVLRGHDIRVIDYEILWKEEGEKELLSQRQVFHASRVMEGSNIEVIRPPIVKIPILDYVSMLWTYQREITRQINEFKPDIVLGNDILTTRLAFRVAKKSGIPTIFYSIDIEHRLVPYRALQPLGKLVESGNIMSADLVISINEGLRDYTIKMGADPEKTHVIRAGIDTQLYDPSVSGDRVKEQYGISDSDKVLFFMGWLYQFSGLKELALELTKIQSLHPEIKLLIVGDGDAFDEINSIRLENHLEDKIILTGRQPYERLAEFIACADVCLLPAYNNEIMRDIVPIKLYEYMAMRKPVISTKLPGVMKEFSEGNGVIYIEKPEDALEKALEIIYEGNITKEGDRARKFVEKLDWEHITDEYEYTLNDMLERYSYGDCNT